MKYATAKWFGAGFILVLIIAYLMVAVGNPAGAEPLQYSLKKGSEGRYAVELSVSRKILILYGIENEKRYPIRQYRVGSAALGLNVYPLGKGHVTAITFDPWWYPTAYSRSVFRKRGIELPAKVPPGHPLNYMGPVKISLSHRTWKGAIYRIHGNNNPERVGRRVTGGCFVMYNSDVLELARILSVGTEVTILP